MRRPAGVIFDLGDTVLHLESINMISANKRLLEFAEGNTDLTAEDVQLFAEELSREALQVREDSMVEYSIQSFQRLLYGNLGISFTIGPYEMEREFWNAAIKYLPCEGIHDVLDLLDKHRIKTGILSNSGFTGTVLLEELKKHNLAHRFSFLISSIDYVFRKPHKRLFQITVRKMGLEPQDIWFVGDKLEYDIRGAIDSGLYPVWYNPENKSGEIDGEYLEVRSWYEFQGRIEELYGR
ncbi:MAG TPA: HAD family hydrolase [Dehalococcoidia bacterium]|nr:HAD family hydrolase [Dehalococcoidia bacterium]